MCLARPALGYDVDTELLLIMCQHCLYKDAGVDGC